MCCTMYSVLYSSLYTGYLPLHTDCCFSMYLEYLSSKNEYTCTVHVLYNVLYSSLYTGYLPLHTDCCFSMMEK